MTAALPADTASPEAYAHPDIARELGRDHARHGCVPPPEQLQPGNPVRQGWEAGRAAFGQRTLPSGRPVRQWLQLRLDAWLRSLAFEPAVNPALLRRIDVARCPVTGEPLGPGTGVGSEAVVVRVNGDAGFAPGNLAVMGTRAARAKTGRGPEAALALARRIDQGGPATIDGLDARQWRRLAVLTSFATPLPHARAAALPMLVLPPSRLHLLNPVQALQVMLSLQVTRAGHARRCAALGALMPSADARHAFHAFMHTLLARRLAAGRLDSFADERAAVERLWEDTLVDRRWRRLVLHLDAAACTRIVELALARGLAGSALGWLPPQRVAEGWALPSRGRLGSDGAGAAAAAERAAAPPARYAARPAVPARPVPEWRTRPAPRPPTS
jgi:hypothetical protein